MSLYTLGMLYSQYIVLAIDGRSLSVGCFKRMWKGLEVLLYKISSDKH